MTPPTTPPQAWSAAVARHAVPPMAVEGGRLVVVAAHPDDETLGTGGFVQAARAAGAHIELVVATDGEAAFGAPDDELRRTRWRDCGPRSASSASTTCPCTASACPTPAWRGATTSSSPRSRRCWRARTPRSPRGRATRTPTTPPPGTPCSPPPRPRRTAGRTRSGRCRGRRRGTGHPWPYAAVFDARRVRRGGQAPCGRRVHLQIGGPEPILAAEVLLPLRSGPSSSSGPADRSAPDQLVRGTCTAAAVTRGQSARAGTSAASGDVVLACLPRPRYRHVAEAAAAWGCRPRGSPPAATGSASAPWKRPSTPRQLRPTRRRAPAALPDADALPTTPTSSSLSEVSSYLLAETWRRSRTASARCATYVLVHLARLARRSPRDAAATRRQPRRTTALRHPVEHVDEFLLDTCCGVDPPGGSAWRRGAGRGARIGPCRRPSPPPCSGRAARRRCVVADRCRDTTAERALAAGVDVVVDAVATIGDVLTSGFRRVVGRLGGVTERMRLLHGRRHDRPQHLDHRRSPALRGVGRGRRRGRRSTSTTPTCCPPTRWPATPASSPPGSRAAPTGTPTPPTSGCGPTRSCGSAATRASSRARSTPCWPGCGTPGTACCPRPTCGPAPAPAPPAGPVAASPTCCAR